MHQGTWGGGGCTCAVRVPSGVPYASLESCGAPQVLADHAGGLTLNLTLALTLTLTLYLTLTRFWLIMLEDSAFYAAFAGLLPMALIGVPLSRTSSLWRALTLPLTLTLTLTLTPTLTPTFTLTLTRRALGRSYEEAIAFHRALGHLMMAACASMSGTSRLLSASVSAGLWALASGRPQASASLVQPTAWVTHWSAELRPSPPRPIPGLVLDTGSPTTASATWSTGYCAAGRSSPRR